jgi:hypothetical protein
METLKKEIQHLHDDNIYITQQQYIHFQKRIIHHIPSSEHKYFMDILNSHYIQIHTSRYKTIRTLPPPKRCNCVIS